MLEMSLLRRNMTKCPPNVIAAIAAGPLALYRKMRNTEAVILIVGILSDLFFFGLS